MTKMLKKESGFTLIEGIVALAILIIGAISIWNLSVLGSRFNAESEDKTVAANIAQLKMEEIMNTRFRYIVAEHPSGETTFESQTQGPPYWTPKSNGEWRVALPGGKYIISYPDGEDADPLRIKVTISWDSSLYRNPSLSLETLVSMTPGRFRM